MFETARLWADLGDYIAAQDGAFCINEVTGPDEYTALVNNNGYTNLMARAHLRFAAALADELARRRARRRAPRWPTAIALRPEEIAAWRRAADLMRIPRDAALGVHAQDDSFLDRAPWPFATTPPSDYPLLLHFHPLVIYRHQVLKQSDVVLAQVLLSSQFTTAEKKRNFDYYDPLTTGDSSLSPCIQSVAAAELGYADAAYRYFMQTARMDLDDVNGNVAHGVHVAAMAGTWVSLVYGFAGLRDDDGSIAFAPRLPDGLEAARVPDAGDRDDAARSRSPATRSATSCWPATSSSIRHFGRPVTVLRGVAGHDRAWTRCCGPWSSTSTASSPTPPSTTTGRGSGWPRRSRSRSTASSTSGSRASAGWRASTSSSSTRATPRASPTRCASPTARTPTSGS